MREFDKQTEHDIMNLRDIAANLGVSIVATSKYQAFHKADQQFQNDPQAQDLLRQYKESQQMLKLMRQMGSNTIEETHHMEDLQEVIDANRTLMNYSQAQEQLIALLRELNEFISARLDLDFSGLTKPQRGCCG